jgi:hypothetical protein
MRMTAALLKIYFWVQKTPQPGRGFLLVDQGVLVARGGIEPPTSAL